MAIQEAQFQRRHEGTTRHESTAQRQRNPLGGQAFRRSTKKNLTDIPTVVFSCKRCKQVVRPIFRKSYITIYRSVVMGLICPRCNNGGLADIDARHDAA